MTYQETLDYLYLRLPMFQRIGPAAYKKDLTNTLALCAHLGNPEQHLRMIHVAGTNGKGSVSHLLAAACQAAGLRTGLYTSPHYKDVRERIRINGQYIPEQQIIDFVADNQEIMEKIEPSFFEVTVAMAFDYFAQEKVDIAIIEVGLGGRLDSTNIITPLLSVITNISYDHQNLLGDTLAAIAGEKAGIIKSDIPVVIGEFQPETAPVFIRKAAEMNARLIFADQHYTVIEQEPKGFSSTVYAVSKDGEELEAPLSVNVAGPYQTKNIATTLQALAVLNQLLTEKAPESPPIAPLPFAAIAAGFAHVRALTGFQGRWQVIGSQPTILCDSAHNEAGLRLAFEQIVAMGFGPAQQHSHTLHIVTGFVNDKEVSKMLPLFPAFARYYFAKADIPRGLDAQLLRGQAATFGLTGDAYTSVVDALEAARRIAAPEDLIVVIGSIFVVAEVIP